MGNISSKGNTKAVVDADAVLKLVALLEVGHPSVQEEVARALGNISLNGNAKAVVDADAVPKLVALLEEDHPSAQVEAVLHAVLESGGYRDHS